MSCDICGRGACSAWMHSLEEQEKYSKVIDLFEKARELREQIRIEIDEETNEST